MKIKVTSALTELLGSQIEDHCANSEIGEDHNTLYIKLAANEGNSIELTEDERRELWSVCDYIEECWIGYPEARRTAKRWRDRVATETDVRR